MTKHNIFSMAAMTPHNNAVIISVDFKPINKSDPRVFDKNNVVFTASCGARHILESLALLIADVLPNDPIWT